MIRRILTHAADLLDHARLARTVLVLDRQNRTLRKLAALEEDRADHLAERLEIAEAAAEEYRARLEAASYTPGIELEGSRAGVRDAATLENRVLSVTEGWAADAERTARAQLNRAEVELAALRAENASLRDDLRKAERIATSRADEITALRLDTARALAGWEEGQRRLARRGVTVTRLASAARTILRTTTAWPRDYVAEGLRARVKASRAGSPDDTADNTPPPTQRSSRRAPQPVSPPRFRATAAAGGES